MAHCGCDECTRKASSKMKKTSGKKKVKIKKKSY